MGKDPKKERIQRLDGGILWSRLSKGGFAKTRQELRDGGDRRGVGRETTNGGEIEAVNADVERDFERAGGWRAWVNAKKDVL